MDARFFNALLRQERSYLPPGESVVVRGEINRSVTPGYYSIGPTPDGRVLTFLAGDVIERASGLLVNTSS